MFSVLVSETVLCFLVVTEDDCIRTNVIAKFMAHAFKVYSVDSGKERCKLKVRFYPPCSLLLTVLLFVASKIFVSKKQLKLLMVANDM